MGNLNRLQENLYQLLIEIDTICKKYDIQYFLAGGTALGTVRNHCFLPWDDDIDLYITRDNWNKLRQVVETQENVLPQGRSLIYMGNTDYYNNPIPRYVDNTTTAIYQSQALPGKACGQHIEMLIMDPMPNEPEQRQEYIKLMKVYTELISPYFVVCKNQSLAEWKEHYKIYRRYLRKIRWFGEEKVMKELEERLLYFPTDECDTFCMRWGIDILMYKKEYFGNGRLETFERAKFPVGENAEGIFRVAYGDSWMYVPDYEEQVVHSSLQDLDTPFSIYTDKYLPKMNRPKIFKHYKRNKHSNAKVFYNRRRLDRDAAMLTVNAQAPSLCKKLDENEEHFRQLLLEKKYDELSEAFADYRRLQFSRDVRKFQIIVPMSDRNICTLVLSCIEQGKYYEANKYLKIRKMQERPLSDELVKAEKTMNACRELSIARYDRKSTQEVKKLLDIYKSEYPELLDVLRAELWVLENEAKQTSDYSEIKTLCEKTLKLYPFDGETMAVLASAEMKLGNSEQAMTWYSKAIENTRNGLVWQRVEDESGISRINQERVMIEERNNGKN